MANHLILASASSARARLLREAGLDFTIEPADIDEDAIKMAHRTAGADALACATTLGIAKAKRVSMRYPGALVIGADQILTIETNWFDKPASLTEAWTQLAELRGRVHCLATSVSVCRDGRLLWQAESEPRLTMRVFSDAFLDLYIAAEGDALLGSVGAYRLEGHGVQLFDAIEGDQFAIQGLPLIELLAYLRTQGAVAT